MTDSDTLAAVERWFRSRNVPHFLDHYYKAFAVRAVYLASRRA